jgi:hypothetical protein
VDYQEAEEEIQRQVKESLEIQKGKEESQGQGN